MRDEELRVLERTLETDRTTDPTALLRLERRAVAGDPTAIRLLRRMLEDLLEGRGPETLRDVTPRSAPALLWLMRNREGVIAKRALFALWDLTLSLRNDADLAVRQPAVRGVAYLSATERQRIAESLGGRRDEASRAWREVLAQDGAW